MKDEINNLLLKMQTNEACIGDTANDLIELFGVIDSWDLGITKEDIATIAQLHDTLLEEEVLGLNAAVMKRSRALTIKMYRALCRE